MMKKIALFFALLVSATVVSAQTFSEGDNNVSLGIGFGDFGVPIQAYYEHGVYDISGDMSIGVGGTIGFASKSENYYGFGEAKYSKVVFGALGNFHYTGVDRFDFTAGLVLGYESVNMKYTPYTTSTVRTYSSAHPSGFYLGLNVGAKYYITEQWAVFTNIGYGVANVTIGATYRF